MEGLFGFVVAGLTAAIACLVQLRRDTNSILVLRPGSRETGLKILSLCAFDGVVAGALAAGAGRVGLADGALAWIALGGSVSTSLTAGGSSLPITKRVNLKFLLSWRNELRETISEDLSGARADQIRVLIQEMASKGVGPAEVVERIKENIEAAGPGFLDDDAKKERRLRVDAIVGEADDSASALKRLLNQAYEWRMHSVIKGLRKGNGR